MRLKAEISSIGLLPRPEVLMIVIKVPTFADRRHDEMVTDIQRLVDLGTPELISLPYLPKRQHLRKTNPYHKGMPNKMNVPSLKRL
jgi:hypothetical protein